MKKKYDNITLTNSKGEELSIISWESSNEYSISTPDPHFHVTPDEVEELIHALRQVIQGDD